MPWGDFFGKISDNKWKKLVNTRMLAQEEGIKLQGKFPLLIRLMRPFTTAITNNF